MSGRNYNIPAKVPSAQSEELTEKPKPSFVHNLLYDNFDEDNEDPEYIKRIISPSLQFYFSIILVVAAITTVFVYFIAIVRYDYQNGAITSNELIAEVTTYLDHFDYEDIQTYLPRTMRSDGFVADSDEFVAFREVCEEDGYKLKSSAIISETVFSDIAQLEQGLSKVYGKTEHISEAKLVQTELLFTNMDGDSLHVVANFIPIKILHKWYLYMGSGASYGDTPVVFLTIQDDTENNSHVVPDISYVEKPDVIESEDIDAIPLDFYKDAKSDLVSGRCIMNGIDRQLPDLFSTFSDVFTLNKDRLPVSQSWTLSQDEMLGNLPVQFADDMFNDTDVYVSVANLSKESVLIQDASITTLCVNKGSLPVLLPGNVTFGTSYTDVVKMYGDLQAIDDTQFKGTFSKDVYALDLGNSRNHIYFGFTDGKLIEIQWFYVDMTNYRGI